MHGGKMFFYHRRASMATNPSPNMNLPIPIVGQEVGPAWANDLNGCMSIIDGHNHTVGAVCRSLQAALISIQMSLSKVTMLPI